MLMTSSQASLSGGVRSAASKRDAFPKWGMRVVQGAVSLDSVLGEIAVQLSHTASELKSH